MRFRSRNQRLVAVRELYMEAHGRLPVEDPFWFLHWAKNAGLHPVPQSGKGSKRRWTNRYQQARRALGKQRELQLEGAGQ